MRLTKHCCFHQCIVSRSRKYKGVKYVGASCLSTNTLQREAHVCQTCSCVGPAMSQATSTNDASFRHKRTLLNIRPEYIQHAFFDKRGLFKLSIILLVLAAQQADLFKSPIKLEPSLPSVDTSLTSLSVAYYFCLQDAL